MSACSRRSRVVLVIARARGRAPLPVHGPATARRAIFTWINTYNQTAAPRDPRLHAGRRVGAPVSSTPGRTGRVPNVTGQPGDLTGRPSRRPVWSSKSAWTVRGRWLVGRDPVPIPVWGVGFGGGCVADAGHHPSRGVCGRSLQALRRLAAQPKAAGRTLLGAVPATPAHSVDVASGRRRRVAGRVRADAGRGRGAGRSPIAQAARDVGTRRRQNRPLLVAGAAGVGLLTGLLANGGGFC